MGRLVDGLVVGWVVVGWVGGRVGWFDGLVVGWAGLVGGLVVGWAGGWVGCHVGRLVGGWIALLELQLGAERAKQLHLSSMLSYHLPKKRS